MLSGPNRLPARGEERPREFEERPCEEDQNAGVCTEAREVSALIPSAASAHPQHTQIPQLVCSYCSVSMLEYIFFIAYQNLACVLCLFSSLAFSI